MGWPYSTSKLFALGAISTPIYRSLTQWVDTGWTSESVRQTSQGALDNSGADLLIGTQAIRLIRPLQLPLLAVDVDAAEMPLIRPAPASPAESKRRSENQTSFQTRQRRKPRLSLTAKPQIRSKLEAVALTVAMRLFINRATSL